MVDRGRVWGDLKLVTDDEALKKAIADKPHLEKMFRWAGLFGEESDRGMVLLSTGCFEELLKNLLLALMVEGGQSRQLLKRGLSTLAVRTQAASALGLITELEKGDLDLLRDIRNDFAHEFDTTFDSEDVVKYCRNLKLTAAENVATASPRMLFMSSALVLMFRLSNRVESIKQEQRIARSETTAWEVEGDTSTALSGC